MTVIEDDPPTYRDGVGAERCRLCHHAVRHAGEPLVSVRWSDLEEAVHRLHEGKDIDPVMERFLQALGLSMGQIKARHEL